MPSIEKTKILVKAALSGQRDKQGVTKYDHCLRVWENGLELCNKFKIEDRKTRFDVELVCLLHDAVEDSDLNEDDLFVFGYSNAVIDAVMLVTHDTKDGTYSDYIDELCASGNVLALIAKLADNIDNTSEERNDSLDEKFKAYLNRRYAGVREKLIKALSDLGYSE